VTGVAGCLLQEVSQDPPQVDLWLIVEHGAVLVEACGISDYSTDIALDLLVALDCPGEARRMCGVAHRNVPPSETAEDPCRFCVCNVVDEPQERRA